MNLLRSLLGGLFCVVTSFGWSVSSANPDKVFYPETWFHYIGGDVSLEGITKDLEAIADAGFSGIRLFHGQFAAFGPEPTSR